MAKADGVFIYIGTYSSEDDARDDYDLVKDMHAEGVVGNYDAAVVTKDASGKVHVNKDETVTRKLGWGGAGVGALIGILFPPSIIGSAVVLGAVGGTTGHLWRGMSRGDVKEFGEIIDEGEAALVIVGELTIESFVTQTVKKAKKQVAKELDISVKELDKELHAAAKELAQVPRPERVHEYRNHHLDSTRWDAVTPRDDDIIITTAYKAGTTWTQRILAALILGPRGDNLSLMEVSPWIDARFMGPLEPMIASIEGQTHRRFVKSHLAADGIRFFDQAKYVVVGRDARDVFMSLWNHYTAYTDFAYELFNDADRPGPEFPHPPPTPRDLWPRWISQGWFDWEPDGWPYWSHHHHIATWWEARDLDNVLFVHYRDLLADTEAEMRRIAGFCAIAVPEETWPEIVRAVGMDAMREDAKTSGADSGAALIFEGGIDRFLFKGTNGRWRDVLTDDDLALYEKAAASLDPELRAWLEGGRHA